ncbi:hypothetical protein M5K25_017228 [Dendrobium thyrsiflorum]|uniref:DUF4283 domain-containing protein n=1 Tax=Dendrobium thyrsiflorum TaxID=117978 RepID=A0ABD0UMI4_DENTH
MPSLWISEEEVLALAAPFSLSLVGYFPNHRPSLELIRRFFFNLKLTGEFYATLLDSRHVMIKLSCDMYYCRIFAHRSYFVSNYFMKLTKWSSFMDIAEESPIVPIWISFPNLRPHFFAPSILHGLSFIFGCPLRTDTATTVDSRPSVARALVELDITKRCPDNVRIGLKKFGYIQSVVIDEFPSYCEHLLKDPTLTRDNLNNVGCMLEPHSLNPIVNVDVRLTNEVHDNVQGNGCVNLTLDVNAKAAVVGLVENESLLLPSARVGHLFDPVVLGPENCGVSMSVKDRTENVVFDNMSSINTICQPLASPAVFENDFCLVNSAVLNGSSSNVHDKSPHSSSEELSPNTAKPIDYVSVIDVPISLISNVDLKAQLSLNLMSPSLDHSDGMDGAVSSPCGGFGDVLDDPVDEMYSLNVSRILEKIFCHRGRKRGPDIDEAGSCSLPWMALACWQP